MAFCCGKSCIREHSNIKPSPKEPINQIKDGQFMPAEKEIMYSSVEKDTLNFMNAANELLEQITSHDALKYKYKNAVNIPRIVVTGTQSSGKSTIINGFIGMDILPVGDNMVTRTPINIRLSTTLSMLESMASISVYKDGFKEIIHNVSFESINIPEFQKKIMEATDRVTDNRFSISKNQIFVDISSPTVENMTIVDLPGIVSISCTDKGQPTTIVEDIKTLIMEQLEYPETYVLAVISALVDLEADAGLAAIKSMQKQNNILRAVGVLTKSDRLKSVAKLNHIINNDINISKDVMLDDGYFIVNNLVPDHSEWYKHTFGSQSSVIQKKRYGIVNLKSHLKKTLMKMIKKSLPVVRSNLIAISKELIEITPKLDDDLDDTKAKLLFINNMTYIISKGITESFNSIGIWRNVGNSIKDTFDTFVRDTSALDPFSISLFSDAELNNIITNFIGYIPNANDPTYLVVNRCLTDETRQPIKLVVPHVEKCIVNLIKIITDSINELLRLAKLDIYPLNLNKYNISLNSFPKLRNFIMDNTIDLLDTYKSKTTQNINHLLSIHERHLVWYDQKDYDDYYANYQNKQINKSTMEDIINTDDVYTDPDVSAIRLKHNPANINVQNPALLRMRTLLKVCFNKIIKTCQDEIYKTIASDIVKEFEHHFFLEINGKFLQMTDGKLNELFYETDEMIKNKKVYDGMAKTIEKLLDQADKLI
jgi:hypothetical protein